MKLRNINVFLVILVALTTQVLFTGWERITLEEYALKEYDGNLTWKEVAKHADWSDRYNPEVVVFDNKMWVIGGYNPGEKDGDSYYADVWSSADGVSWSLATDNAPWKGRRGHRVINFNDGRPLSNQFYNRKEKFVAFSLCLDM